MQSLLVTQCLRYCILCFVAAIASGSSSNSGMGRRSCSYDYEINCHGGYPYVATTRTTFMASTTSASLKGEAYVTFHWGKNHADSVVGSVLQPTYIPRTLVESHDYFQEGEYYAGVSIVFGPGSGCEGVELRGYKLLKFDRMDCAVIDLGNIDDDDNGMTLSTTSSTSAMDQQEEAVATTASPPLISTSTASSYSCSFDYEIDCNNNIPYSATAWVTFDNPNYKATVTFHWGLDDNTIKSRLYTLSQPGVEDTFIYTNEGEYYAGYTVVFGDGSGCNGMTFQGYKLLWYDDETQSCDVFDDQSVPTTLASPTVGTTIGTSTTSSSVSSSITTLNTPTPSPVSTASSPNFQNHPTTASTTCAYEYEVICINPFSATAYVTFQNPAYEASITFHWDIADTVIDAQYYSSSQPSMVNTYNFGSKGVYKVGVSIAFSKGYGCDDVVYETYHTLSFDGLSCQVTESNNVNHEQQQQQQQQQQENNHADDAEVVVVVVQTNTIAPTISSTELLGQVEGDWTGIPITTTVTKSPSSSSSSSSSIPTMLITTIITEPPMPLFPTTTTGSTTIQQGESSFPTEVAQFSSLPSTYMPTTTTTTTTTSSEQISTYSPTLLPRTGTEPIPVSKNMLTSGILHPISSSSSFSMMTILLSVTSYFILHSL